jgi:predicted acylesterase/phospholipase RssA
LFDPGAKRILSLDGGGVRGILSLGILETIERQISELEGKPIRLGEWFDLIGGTSTGSIIATGLALGMSVAELRALYLTIAPRIFKRSWRRIVGWQAKFDERNIAAELRVILGERTLDTPDLKTGLSIVLKRLDTDSSWILTNNSRAKYWNDAADGSFDGNRRLLLADLVRASTAAPGYFDPELVALTAGEPSGLFVDGALTLHNNPALALALTALIPAYGLQWRAGAETLLVVSVGTGSYRTTVRAGAAERESAAMLAVRSLASMISESEDLVLTMMGFLGQSAVPWRINSEIGDLGVGPRGAEPMFRFLRYDARLEVDWLRDELGRDFAERDVLALRHMDDVTSLQSLLEVGRAAGGKLVQPNHWSGFRRSPL